MNEVDREPHKRNRWDIIIIRVFLVYLIIGFAFNMYAEFGLAKKYGMPYSSALLNPWSYIRSVIFAPFWSVYVAANLYHYQNPFGGPITPVPR